LKARVKLGLSRGRCFWICFLATSCFPGREDLVDISLMVECLIRLGDGVDVLDDGNFFTGDDINSCHAVSSINLMSTADFKVPR
jgi:hypothetical protein